MTTMTEGVVDTVEGQGAVVQGTDQGHAAEEGDLDQGVMKEDVQGPEVHTTEGDQGQEVHMKGGDLAAEVGGKRSTGGHAADLEVVQGHDPTAVLAHDQQITKETTTAGMDHPMADARPIRTKLSQIILVSPHTFVITKLFHHIQQTSMRLQAGSYLAVTFFLRHKMRQY